MLEYCVVVLLGPTVTLAISTKTSASERSVRLGDAMNEETVVDVPGYAVAFSAVALVEVLPTGTLYRVTDAAAVDVLARLSWKTTSESFEPMRLINSLEATCFWNSVVGEPPAAGD